MSDFRCLSVVSVYQAFRPEPRPVFLPSIFLLMIFPRQRKEARLV
jgi:hypothetical protein